MLFIGAIISFILLCNKLMKYSKVMATLSQTKICIPHEKKTVSNSHRK